MSQSRNQIVSFLRVLALLCILMHHSMCMYCGWPPIFQGWENLRTFAFEGLLSGSFKLFGLSVFTFLSGFVLYYQRNKNKSYLRFIYDKIIRLILPCALFAIAYKFLFPSMMFDGSPINGTHLWFVPMIFVCILVTSIQVYHPHLWWAVIGLYLVAVKMQNYISFRTLYEFVHYYPIFYIGFLFNAILCDGVKIPNKIKQPFSSQKVQVLIAILCGLSIPIFSKITHRCYVDGSSISVSLLIAFIYYVASRVRICDRGGWFVLFAQKHINIIDKNSFAIYLLHQFIINICLLTMHNFLETIPTFLGSCIVCSICFVSSLGLAELYDIVITKIKK